LSQDREREGNGTVEEELEEDSRKRMRCTHKDQHERYHGHIHGHGHGHGHGALGDVDIDEELGECEGPCAEADEAEVRVGKKRQVVGILVRCSSSNYAIFLSFVLNLARSFSLGCRSYKWVSCSIRLLLD
jgi:hypothetical protein